MILGERRRTREELLQLRVVGWVVLLGAPLAFAFMGIVDWITTPVYKITIFEQVVWYAILPLFALFGIVLGCCIVWEVSRDLRQGNFRQESEG